ncbi:MAG: zinc-ribbon domain containing protein [Dehalococcoidales bacterium]|nr:zinc-ribbon domain containing protein [Dehalococcoidales bacterium]
MSRDGDMNLTCRQCGREFVFSETEQDFYNLKGFLPPSRCRECRSLASVAENHNHNHNHSCAQCGTKLEKEAPVFCTACLKNTQLGLERKVRQGEKVAKAAQAKLKTTEFRKAELEDALYQTEQMVADLDLKVSNLSQDLEKAKEAYVASGWIKPLLQSIEERLKALESTQCESNQRIFEIIHTMQKRYENTGLFDIIKRSLIPYRGQGT